MSISPGLTANRILYVTHVIPDLIGDPVGKSLLWIPAYAGMTNAVCKICYTACMTVIDHYLKQFAPSERAKLERIRDHAKKFVPDAEEVIGYGMPTLKYHGKAFLGFDLHKNHIGIYPYGGAEIEALRDKLTTYKTSTGAIQVPLDQEFPEDLLREIIQLRIQRIEEKK